MLICETASTEGKGPYRGNTISALGNAQTSSQDAELSAFFAPPFPYRNVWIDRGADGRTLVTITTNSALTKQEISAFKEDLRHRSVNIYGPVYYGEFSWNRTSADAAVTVTRKVEGEGDTIAISEGVARDLRSNEPLMSLTVSERELFIPLTGDFGKIWRKVRIIAEPEPPAPEPKTGRYPGSRVHRVLQDDTTRKQVIYAVRGRIEDVKDFFAKKLKEVHATFLLTGDLEGPSVPDEVFGIKTSARRIMLSGYTFKDKKLFHTEVTIRRADDPTLTDFVEVEVVENWS